MKQFECTKCNFTFPYADDAVELQCPSCGMKFGRQQPKLEPMFEAAHSSGNKTTKSGRLALVIIILVAILGVGALIAKGVSEGTKYYNSKKDMELARQEIEWNVKHYLGGGKWDEYGSWEDHLKELD